MMDNKNKNAASPEKISGSQANSGQVLMFEQYRLLKRTWWWVLLIALLATGGTAYYLFNFVPDEYKATLVALPPNKTGTPLDNLVGGVASTLKDFGLSKLAGKASSDGGYSRTVFLTSRRLMDSLIRKYNLVTAFKDELPKDRPDLIYDILASKLDIELSMEGPVTVNVYDVDAARAKAMAMDVINYTNILARDFNRLETDPITRFVGERYEKSRNDQERLSKELRQFMVDNKIYDPESQAGSAGVQFMQTQANAASYRTIYDTYLKALGAEDPRTVQARQMMESYDQQVKKMAAGRAGPVNTLSLSQIPKVSVEYLRIRQDYEVNAKVLALLEPLYEQTKYDAVKDIPVLNVLDPAFVPLKKARPKRSLILASVLLGAFLCTYVVIALGTYFRAFQNRFSQYRAQQGSPAVVNGLGPVIKQEQPDEHSVK